MKDAKDNEGHSIKILGRAGMIYRDGDEEYFVDCEMLVGPLYDLVVYTDSVKLRKDNGESLSDGKKKEIIKVVAQLLESVKIRAEFQP